MKKRSKTEVEIRNILSELLLDLLSSTAEIEILGLILKYCNKTSRYSNDAISIIDLLGNRAKSDSVEFNFKQLSKDAHLKWLFVFGSGSSIKLKKRYSKHRTFICRKTKDYLKLISRMESTREGFDDKLQYKVKIGVMLYNQGFFFECHEFLEEIWLKEKGREKAFLKGLIHACVAFYHFEYENIRGTVNYLKRASATLKEFQPTFLGVDVSSFVSDIERCIKSFEESKPKYMKATTLQIKQID